MFIDSNGSCSLFWTIGFCLEEKLLLFKNLQSLVREDLNKRPILDLLDSKFSLVLDFCFNPSSWILFLGIGSWSFFSDLGLCSWIWILSLGSWILELRSWSLVHGLGSWSLLSFLGLCSWIWILGHGSWSLFLDLRSWSLVLNLDPCS